jgi:multiple sugar transport system substrate-binding protein
MKYNLFSKLNKKFATFLVVSTVLASSILAGCGANNVDNAKEGSKDKTVTLNVWGMGEEAKSLPKIAKEFEKENPNIDVKVQAIPWDQAHDKLLTAVASKKGPDVIQMGTTWIPEFASANALMDITPYLKDYPELNPENFYEGSVTTTKFDDKTVGVPWYVDTRVLYYRTDLLKDAGYAEAPKSWEELSDAAAKLAKRGDKNYGISIDANEQSLAFMFARQNGSKLFDEQGKPLFNEKEFVDAVKYLNSFYQNGSAPKDDIGIDIIQAFKAGIIPMFISGPWMVKLINDQAPDIKGKWATAVLPAGKENNVSVLGGANLSIFQYTKNKDAALKFAAYMSKPETQVEWFKMVNALPAAKEAWNDSALQEDPNLKVFGQQMEAAQPMPVIQEFEEIAQTYLKSFEKIYRSGADVQKEMDEFNKKAEKILNK